MTLKTTVLIIESCGLYYCCRRQTRTYSDWSTYKCDHTPLNSTYDAYWILDVTKKGKNVERKTTKKPNICLIALLSNYIRSITIMNIISKFKVIII